MFTPAVYEWGLDVIRAFQTLSSPPLDGVVKILTRLGDPVVGIGVALFIYWCVDKKKGFKFFFLLFLAFALNVAMKALLKVPRPFLLDPAVALIPETGFSTPSGHAQGSAAFWTLLGWICFTKHRRTGAALAVVVPVVVSLTRVYLGVHVPTDVLLGLAAGYLSALGGIHFYDPLGARISPLRPSFKALLIAALCFCLNALSGGEVNASGALFGFTLGYVLLRAGRAAGTEHGLEAAGDARGTAAGVAPPRDGGALFRKLLHLGAGGLVCSVTYLGPRVGAYAAGLGDNPLVGFIRYALVGFAAAFIVPRMLSRLS
ncbi:MAG: phosphatase PAP2 family protein [Spirochaetaceae bacterium]|jgi:membrane-associated phospholipid phosphatase|nr:phosphatase PAP2 family protein [Spirochaetaceae bacterium]